MNRKYAISIAVKKIKKNPIISANGYISRDLFSINDKAANFYMIGSMGLASSIGLGIAIKNPKKRIFVFDGDGNILMNLGSLTTIVMNLLEANQPVRVLLTLQKLLKQQISKFFK